MKKIKLVMEMLFYNPFTFFSFILVGADLCFTLGLSFYYLISPLLAYWSVMFFLASYDVSRYFYRDMTSRWFLYKMAEIFSEVEKTGDNERMKKRAFRVMKIMKFLRPDKDGKK